jgi:hypothetical protein
MATRLSPHANVEHDDGVNDNDGEDDDEPRTEPPDDEGSDEGERAGDARGTGEDGHGDRDAGPPARPARSDAPTAASVPTATVWNALVDRLAAVEARMAPPRDAEQRRSRRQGRGTTSQQGPAARQPSGSPSDSEPSNSSSDDDRDQGRRGRRSSRDASDSSGDSGDSSSGSESGDDGGTSNGRNSSRGAQRGRRERRAQRNQRERQGRQPRRDGEQPRRKSVKDLELPSFTPSPKVSVAPWIDRVDLALRGAEESGRGTWSDASLYYILGNKLMDNAAKWWVNINRKLDERGRTWTNLKKMLLRRYAEKLDKSTAEWRVNMRRMMPGETYADFAAGLRDVVGRNKVSERVLLAQFYRCLDKTTKKLVRQSPKPRNLEDAVDKATEIDDPMDNVAQGMMNVGLPWATAPNPYVVAMAGTTGQTLVIPGIGGTSLPAEVTRAVSDRDVGVAPTAEAGQLALFTNPQGIYNVFSGTWDTPPGYTWNGKYWVRMKPGERKRDAVGPGSRAESRKPAGKTRARPEPEPSDDDEPPRKKRVKFAVR